MLQALGAIWNSMTLKWEEIQTLADCNGTQKRRSRGQFFQYPDMVAWHRGVAQVMKKNWRRKRRR